MIKKIAHFADIHIRKTPTRNTEYEHVFNKTIKSLLYEKPDRIVISGDLVNDYLDLQGEQLILANHFLFELSKIAPVRITRGNHDCRKKSIKRVDSIKAIVKTLNNDNICYYDNVGFYDDENITWAVWHHGIKNNNPWRSKIGKEILKNGSNNTTIDLFHDPINGCLSTTNFEMKNKSYYKISDFNGDLSMFGDIHKMQFLDKNKTKAYCGSLIAQDISEGDDNFHGYLMWDVDTKVAKPIEIKSDWTYKNIDITPYTDFDDLELEIDEPSKYMTVRFLWKTLPDTRNNNNERKIVDYIKNKYSNVTISHKNIFIEEDKIDGGEDITIENIANNEVQQDLFRNYLLTIGVDDDIIDEVLELDDEITSEIENTLVSEIEWSIIKFKATNFMSYSNINIDWRDNDGLYQITGINTAGKTTIMKLITYLLFGKSIETESRLKFGDIRYINNRNDAEFCEGEIVIEANGEYYGIKRKTSIEKTKSGKITSVPTTLTYYKLNDPDDQLIDDNSIDKLDEDDRNKTQKTFTEIIGDYNNFMRVVMTTSDTLNKIFNSDKSEFIDSILLDSGLDVFDKKLEGYKSYVKREKAKSRIVCDVNSLRSKIELMKNENIQYNDSIIDIESNKLKNLKESIVKGNEYVQQLNGDLFPINPEISNLNVDNVRSTITIHERKIKDYESKIDIINESLNELKDSFDSERFDNLIILRDNHKDEIHKCKTRIIEYNRDIDKCDHEIALVRGKIFTFNRDIKSKKNSIIELKSSETCPTCKRLMDEKHQVHINNEIEKIDNDINGIINNINELETITIPEWENNIKLIKKSIEDEEELIIHKNLEFNKILEEIGVLNNDKNDVLKRNELLSDLKVIPITIQNEELKITALEGKIKEFNEVEKQIERNNKIKKRILQSKEKLIKLENERDYYVEEIQNYRLKISNNNKNITLNETTINDFLVQEHREHVLNLYKKCVHRDGIPTQILMNNIIPKINVILSDLLQESTFKVWLDPDDLKPKLIYNSRPDSIIECVSGSGKERTFSSVVIKFCLNQINIKAKPTIFLLDEVMGKLNDESIEEFINIIRMIKSKMKKILVVEHNHEINPDYVLDVTLDDNGISSVNLI